ncbi:MAG TPA: leucyl aminopeptidase [Abditibacteriaceae bacterium]|jgi:leucyl aminopeptidase
MNIQLSTQSALETDVPCLVVPVWQNADISGVAEEINEKMNGLVTEVFGDGFKGAAGETRVLYAGDAVGASRVMLCGWGVEEKLTAAAVRRIAAKAARGVRSIKRASFAFVVPETRLPAETVARAVVEGIELGLHVCHEYKTAEDSKPFEVESATLIGLPESVQGDIAAAQIEANANIKARAWVNRPSNLKSPIYLAERAQLIADERGLQCEVWDENRIQAERMGALWGVGMGSANPPRFIRLDYTPAGTENDAPIILVGKGMSYDTGGYSLKPSTSMEDMKDDMGGAAAVLGAMDAIAALQIPKRVIMLVPSAENMVSGNAQRVGDIVTARNGKTIEVLNTDAEGRLILADALSYASELNPRCIIDFATLTGAISIALGQEAAGLFANDDELASAVTQAGETSGERVWQFPMWDEYKDHVKGTISDLKNLGTERRAGSIAAAVFLENFVASGIPWAHVDIAAVAFVRENRPLVQRGATGYGVRLAVELVRNI